MEYLVVLLMVIMFIYMVKQCFDGSHNKWLAILASLSFVTAVPMSSLAFQFQTEIKEYALTGMIISLSLFVLASSLWIALDIIKQCNKPLVKN